jgi:DNA relaxase NicK
MTVVSPVFIDWITAKGANSWMGSWVQKHHALEQIIVIPRAYHRSVGLQYLPSAWRVYYSPEDKEVNSVTVLDGTALSNIRRQHDNDWCNKEVAQLAKVSDKFTRIDLAVDIMDEGLYARHFYNEAALDYEAFCEKFPRRKVSLYKSTGTTVYIGSRTSPLMLRVYDKNSESRGQIPSTRVEIELKDKYAQHCHSSMLDSDGWLKATSLFTTYLRRLSSWQDFPTVESLLTGEVVTVAKQEREKMWEKKEWLRRQVMPTFTKAWESEGKSLLSWFVEEVQKKSS